MVILFVSRLFLTHRGHCVLKWSPGLRVWVQLTAPRRVGLDLGLGTHCCS